MRIPISTHTLQIGPYEGRSFTHTEIYEPIDPRQKEYGRVVFVMEAAVHPELGAELQDAILGSMKEHFYSDLARDPYDSFESTLQVINDRLANLHVKGVTDWVGKLNVLLAILSDTTLHLTQSGDAGLFLVRGESATNISSGLSPTPEEVIGEKTFFNISSGTLLQGDHLLLITNSNYDSVADRDLVHTLRTVNFNDRTALNQKLGSLNLHGTPVDMLVIRIGSSSRSLGVSMDDESEMGTSSMSKIQSVTGVVASQAKQLFNKLKGSMGRESAPADEMDELTESEDVGQLYGKGPVTGKTRLSNTFQLLKDNSLKGIGHLFNRKHRSLLTARTNKKKLLTWVLIIIIVIAGSYWLIQQRKASSEHREMVQMLQDIRDGKGIAKTRSIYEPDSAKTLLIGLQNKAQRIINESNDAKLRVEAQTEIEELSTLLDRVDSVYRIAAPKVAYDISKERPNIAARGLFGLGGQLFAFDHNAIYKLVLDSIDTRKVVVGQQEDIEVIDADSFGQENEAVLLTKDHGIVEYKDSNFAFGVTQDAAWHTGVAITDYDQSRLIYVLDAVSSEIWKYTRARAGFESATKKNVAGQDLTQTVDFAIDGAIYLLTKTGTVVKYFDDAVAPFEFSGLTLALNNPVKILADSDLEAGFLYILDSGNKRVVVTDKGGAYIAQYVLPSSEKLVDMFIDETNDLIYVLESNGKVYEMTIQHY